MIDSFTELHDRMKRMIVGGHAKSEEIKTKAQELQEKVKTHVQTGVGSAKDIFNDAKAYVDGLTHGEESK